MKTFLTGRALVLFSATLVVVVSVSILALVMFSSPAPAQVSPVTQRYQGLAASKRFKLAEVMGTPEMSPAGGHTCGFTADAKLALFCAGGFSPFQEQTDDCHVTLWDVQKSKMLKEIAIAKSAVTAAAISSDGKIAVGNVYTADGKGKETNRIVLWDMETAKEAKTLADPKGLVFSIALSPDGKRVLAGTQDGKIYVWDVATGKEAAQLKLDQPEGIARGIFSHDGKKAIIASGTKIRVWDLATSKVVRTLEGHVAEVVVLALSADGKRLGSSAFDQVAHVWDLESGKSLAKTKQPVVSSGILSLGLSADGGKMLIVMTGLDAMTGTKDVCAVSLLDVAPQKELWTQPGSFKGLVPIALTGKNEAIVGGGPNQWTLWELEKGQVQSVWGGHKSSVVAVASDGVSLYSLGQEGDSKVWGKTGTPKTFLTLRESATALVGGPNLVLAASADKALLTWNDKAAKATRVPTSHTAPITCLALATSGKRALSAGGDRVVKYWDLESSKEIASFTGHSEGINAVAIAPDGKWAASASDDNTIRLWPLDKKLADDDDRIVLEQHKRQVTCLAFSPDGKYLVSGSQDQTLKVWDTTTLKVVKTLEGHKNWIGAVMFVAPDQVVSASDDLTVRVWNIKDGKEIDKIDFGPVSDCPKSLTWYDGNLYVGTAGWVVLKFETVAEAKKK